MERYTLTGLCCDACAGRVEKAVTALDGVERCTVIEADQTMEVEGAVLPEIVIAAVEAAGYGAALEETSRPEAPAEEESDEISEEVPEEAPTFPEAAESEDMPAPAPRSRRADWILLGVSAVLLAGLMYLALGHLAGLPAVIADPVTAGIVQAVLAAAVMAVNWKAFGKAFDFRHGAPNGETLAVLGAVGAFLYSAFALYMVSRYQSLGQTEALAVLSHSFCFEAAGLVVFARLCTLLTEKYAAAPSAKDAGICFDLLLLAVLTAAGWLEAGQSLGMAVVRGVSVLAISCPVGVLLAVSAGKAENGRKKMIYGLVWMAVYHVIALLLASGILGVTLHPVLCSVIMCLAAVSVLLLHRKAPKAAAGEEEAAEEEPAEEEPAEEEPAEEAAAEEEAAEEEATEEETAEEETAEEETAEEEPAEEETPAEEELLRKTIHIEGLQCPHCETRTKQTLEMLGQVIRAEVSYTDGTAVVTMKGDISDRILIAAVEAEGYKVTSIE